MAIKLNKVALNLRKADVILFNPQPNVYLKKAEEMHLGLHHSRSILLLSLRNFFSGPGVCFSKLPVITGPVKVPLTPKNFFLLKKSASFPDFISEKIISIDKILAFLQAFEHIISMFMTAQSGIWVGLLVTSLRETG